MAWERDARKERQAEKTEDRKEDARRTLRGKSRAKKNITHSELGGNGTVELTEKAPRRANAVPAVARNHSKLRLAAD